MTDKIAETADPGQVPTGVGSHYSLEKTFEQSGHTLIVDADITGGDESKMAVLTVAEKPFESGNSLKKVVDIFFPDYKVYEYNEFTKDDLQQQIDQAQLMIFRLKNGLNTLTGEPLKENEQQSVFLPEALQNVEADELKQIDDLTMMEMYLDELQQKYKKAPSDDRELADYIIKLPDDSTMPQENLRLKKGTFRYLISFVNPEAGDKGSFFTASRIDNEFIEDNELPQNTTSISNLKNPEELTKIKQLLIDLELNYMELYKIYQGENACQYIFTRSYNGAQEDYVGEYLGLSPIDGENMIAQGLWKPEYFSIITYKGEIQQIRWENPSQIVKVDNENVKILPWSEIQKIFEKQMEFLLTPSSEGGDSMFWWKPSDVKIERITLGLAKMLMKDSGEYKLIPVWNFFGRDNSNSDMDDAEEKCYVTINALNGTIMDRDVMY